MEVIKKKHRPCHKTIEGIFENHHARFGITVFDISAKAAVLPATSRAHSGSWQPRRAMKSGASERLQNVATLYRATAINHEKCCRQSAMVWFLLAIALWSVV
jgi:hypothetical protein